MSTTPRISLVAFEDRTPAFIFASIPDERGRYVRTDRSVALVGCRLCGALVGEPCFSGNPQRKRYGGTTHVWRRAAADRLVGRGYRADDVLAAADVRVPDEWMEAQA